MLRSRFWHNFDWILATISLILVAMGLLVIYATAFKATSFTTPTELWHQLVFLVGGLAAMLFLARTDYRQWRGLTPWIYGLTLILLVIVLIFSRSVLGATRWIDLGFFQFQPSEFAKLALIIVLARYFSDHYDDPKQFKVLAISLLYLAIPMLLVMRQPDLGTSLVMIAIWTAMAIVARIPWRYLVGIMVGATALLPLVWALLKPFQRARLETFLNPTADPLGTGYNAYQSTVTVGSGQLYGRGLGAGTQTQLGFLPTLAQHTDFIFAALAEKLGFIGSSLVLLLFLGLLWRGLQIAWRAGDRFGTLIATGIVAMLAFHIIVNIGMNMGVAPVTGIPLPFISYGGTSLIISLASIGLLESIAVRRKKIEFDT